MATEVNENTKLTLDLKTIGIIVSFVISLATIYYSLKSEIAVAMTEPKPEVTSTEFKYKDELIRKAIMTTQEDVKEMKETLRKLEARMYEIIRGE
jgi:hypothetical protein|tara:strand:- start:252 stop:536 length:285 start_codon:yes stop_codon:yes gene_type:complete